MAKLLTAALKVKRTVNTPVASPGTLLLITGIIVGLVYRMSPALMAKVFGRQVYKLRWTFLTIGSVLALAYVMNLSGQTITVGTWIDTY